MTATTDNKSQTKLNGKHNPYNEYEMNEAGDNFATLLPAGLAFVIPSGVQSPIATWTRGGLTSFTGNNAIFDRNYIESLFGGVEYPDGIYVIDCVDELIEHQKIFMEVISEIRQENMFTFPVLTYSLLKRNDITKEEAEEMIRNKDYDVFVDKDFARWCSDHNVMWNDIPLPAPR